jgi:hypothetical protein
MSNYPDDIRQYDSHPSSPFYAEPPECEECGHDLQSDTKDEFGCPEVYCSNAECITNE